MRHAALPPRILAAVLLAAACTTADGSGVEVVEATPAAAPAIAQVRKIDAAELTRIAGVPGDRTRVVNFWATWCGPCVGEIPEMVAFAAAHPEVEVVLVNLDYPTLTKTHVVPFVERQGITGVEVVQLDDADPAGAVARAVPAWPYAIPYTLVLDESGERLAAFSTAIDRTHLRDAVAKASPR